MEQLESSYMSVSSYCDWWDERERRRGEEEEERLLYLKVCHADAPTPMTRGKDWNLAKLEEMKRKADEREGGQQEGEESKQMTKRIYKCPEHFEEDWLNRYERNFASDHRCLFLHAPLARFILPFLPSSSLNAFS